MADAPEQHLGEELLERFFRLELSRAEAARLIQHLLSACPRCQGLVAAVAKREEFNLWPDEAPAETAAPQEANLYSPVFSKLLEVPRDEDILRLARERVQGVGLLAELEQLPLAERACRIRADSRFHHWGLFDRILSTYLSYSRHNPQAGVDLVGLALVVLETLDLAQYSPELLADFRASALGALGNALRLAGRLPESQEAFVAAWENLDEGTGDPLEEANLLSLEGSLFSDRGHFKRAAALLDRAIAIYDEIGDDNARARMLIKKANALGYLEPLEGIAILQDALAILHVASEPRMELYARHNLTWFLTDAGQPQDALALLESSRPLYKAFADPWSQLRLQWLEGRIARALGDLQEAEAVFRKIWHAFEERNMHFEQTLVSIDLAEAYSAEGKLEEAAKLVTDFLPVLRSWGMHAEGLAMWKVFSDSIVEHAHRQIALTAEAFRSITLYFHRSWHQPAVPET
jgi:tetratricopeptide (TPR) repeat protein